MEGLFLLIMETYNKDIEILERYNIITLLLR